VTFRQAVADDAVKIQENQPAACQVSHAAVRPAILCAS
jgi:hypothetical protein